MADILFFQIFEFKSQYKFWKVCIKSIQIPLFFLWGLFSICWGGIHPSKAIPFVHFTSPGQVSLKFRRLWGQIFHKCVNWSVPYNQPRSANLLQISDSYTGMRTVMLSYCMHFVLFIYSSIVERTLDCSSHCITKGSCDLLWKKFVLQGFHFSGKMKFSVAPVSSQSCHDKGQVVPLLLSVYISSKMLSLYHPLLAILCHILKKL